MIYSVCIGQIQPQNLHADSRQRETNRDHSLHVINPEHFQCDTEEVQQRRCHLQ